MQGYEKQTKTEKACLLFLVLVALYVLLHFYYAKLIIIDIPILFLGLKNKKKILDFLIKINIRIRLEKSFENLKINKINIDLESGIIELFFESVRDRIVLESYVDVISSALFNDYVAFRTYPSKNENSLLIEFEDVSKERGYVIENIYDLFDIVRETKYNELIIDKKTSVDLAKNPHLLVAGTTGSGKTYFVQGLIIQSLIKKYEVEILDIKQTYGQMAQICHLATNKEEILSLMHDIEFNLLERQKLMKKHLAIDSNLIACDCQIPNKLIVVEEYIALTSILNKKELLEFERILTEVIVLGRQLGIHVVIVTQIAMATTISSNIRSNLAKIALRCNDESVLKTTFGLSTSTRLLKKSDVGEGLICLESDIIPIKTMFFKCNMRDLIKCFKRE